jgi:preprotein translocase subunit SecG
LSLLGRLDVQILIIIGQVMFVLISVLMAFAILLQEGKGGGLSALAGGGSQQIIGTSNPLRRITVIFAIAFFGLAIFLVKAMTSANAAGAARADRSDQIETTDRKNQTDAGGAPVMPVEERQ